MQKSPFSNPEFNLWILLYHTAQVIYRARQKELQAHNLLSRQSSVLFALHALGNGTTPGGISRFVCREPHTISELLSRMEKRGLVKKVRYPSRKNMVRISITEEGEKAYQKSLSRESINRIMKTLSEDERHQLKAYLMKLFDKAFEELREVDKPPFLQHI